MAHLYVVFFICAAFFVGANSQCEAFFEPCEYCMASRRSIVTVNGTVVRRKEELICPERRSILEIEDTFGVEVTCIICGMGSWCDGNIEMPCLAGTYCDGGCCDCMDCDPGTYASGLYNSQCTNCNAGCYCSGYSNTGSCPNSCVSGDWCPSGSSSASNCPKGYYCSTNAQNRYSCSPGKYNDLTRQTSSSACKNVDAGCHTDGLPARTTSCPISCDPGDYCPAGSSTPQDCSAGYYCPGATSEIPCGSGRYGGSRRSSLCPQTSAGCWSSSTTATTSCPNTCSTAGSYCPAGSTSQGTCTAGYYCPSSSGRTPCGAGRYGGSGRSTACPETSAGCWSSSTTATTACPNTCSTAGSYCPTGSTSEGSCTAGYYCPTSSSRTVCGSGRYSTGGRSTTCPLTSAGCWSSSSTATSSCPNVCSTSGSYCPLGSTSEGTCTAGYYCPSSSGRTPCGTGKWSNSGRNTPCPDVDAGCFGSSTTSTNSCPSPCASNGNYCPSGSSSVGDCPAGYYCASSDVAVPCGSGRYGSTRRTTTCPQTNAGCWSSSTTATTACPNSCSSPGSYCPVGSTSEGSCTAGYYCTSSTSRTVCGSGKYSTGGLSSPCPPTSAGCWSSSTTATSSCPNSCSTAGDYCPAGSTSALDCTAGYYCPSSSGRTPCGAGRYGGARRSTTCPQTNAGCWSSSTTATTACPNSCSSAGDYCPAGSTSAGDCTAGYYCPSSSGRTPCGAGRYSGTRRSTTCPQTNAGCWSSSTTATSSCPNSCSSGDYCPAGSTSKDLCPTGSYCTNPSSISTCSTGSWCPEGSTSENDCTAGFYCSTPSSRQSCTAGSYCPSGTSQTNPDCPAGSYCTSTSSIATCTNTGAYCPARSQSHGACPAGSYCPDTTTKIDCDAGTYNSLTSQTSSTACAPCPAGKYCPSTGVSTPSDCGIGKYCPESSTSENDCPAGGWCSNDATTFNECSPGSYSSATGQTSSGTCSNCDAGSWCESGSNSATQHPCGGGCWCGVGSDNSCPNFCDAGYYCNGGSDNAQQNACEYSYYCPVGTAFPTPCNCTWHGTCDDGVDNCVCEPSYGGTYCDQFMCHGKTATGGEACSKNGICYAIDTCVCYEGYKGKICDYWYCNGTLFNATESDVCNGRGICERPDRCACSLGYGGDNCELEVDVVGPSSLPIGDIILIATGVIAGIVGFVLVVAFIVGLFSLIPLGSYLKAKKKLNKYGDEITMLELEEKENENGNNNSVAKFKINKKLMQIDSKEMKLLKKLGAGAFAEVFLCNWGSKKVAMKLFQTNTMSNTQEFDDFEKELSILSSISHPNILQFFGCSLRPPRVGIVMEFCPNGDLRSYLQMNDSLELNEKMEILSGIVSAMIYLHKRDIIHRDLKTENVLLSDKVEPKVCDFGLSKVVEKSNSRLTRRTGTSFYMAPEVTLGEKYDNKCDIFSFSIIMFEVLTQNCDPYGYTNENIELKVANNKSFRPSLKEKEYKHVKWLVKLIKRCWNHNPQQRPSFEEIKNIFEKNFEFEEETPGKDLTAPPKNQEKTVEIKYVVKKVVQKNEPKPIQKEVNKVPKRPESLRKKAPPKPKKAPPKPSKKAPPKPSKKAPPKPSKKAPGRPMSRKTPPMTNNVPSWKRL